MLAGYAPLTAALPSVAYHPCISPLGCPEICSWLEELGECPQGCAQPMGDG